MKLLNFTLPASTNIQYVSEKARDVWKPKIQNVSQVFSRLEIESVRHGLRRTANLNSIPHDRLMRYQQHYESMGLVFLPVNSYKASESGFSHFSAPTPDSEHTHWLAVVARHSKDAEDWKEARLANDDQACGELFGYPECCIDFFKTAWSQGYFDPIWQQSVNANASLRKVTRDQFLRLRKETPWETSGMLRYMGIRVNTHIACCPDCQQSVEIAREWLELGRELEIDAIDDLENLLKMPVEWNVSHGIAYVTTPIFRIEASSVPSESPYIVQREGNFMPEESARGLKFPFL